MLDMELLRNISQKLLFQTHIQDQMYILMKSNNEYFNILTQNIIIINLNYSNIKFNTLS